MLNLRNLGIFPGIKKQKKDLVRLGHQINFAFSKLDNDVQHVQNWLSHLHDRSQRLETSHSSHIELTRNDMNNLNHWIKYLHNHSLEVQKYMKELNFTIIELHKRDNSISERLSALEKDITGQLRTLEGTFQGHLEDKRTSERTSEDDEKNGKNLSDDIDGLKKLQEKVSKASDDISNMESIGGLDQIEKKEKPFHINKSSLSGSQIELLNVLYNSDRPLSYKEISDMLGKKEKSVRNLIYETRDKGIPIKSRFVGLRKKGFFLTKEAKIEITGR